MSEFEKWWRQYWKKEINVDGVDAIFKKVALDAWISRGEIIKKEK